jgi:hypothetical protein
MASQIYGKWRSLSRSPAPQRTIFIKMIFQVNNEPKVMRGALWDSTEGEIKDFIEWYIGEECPM